MYRAMLFFPEFHSAFRSTVITILLSAFISASTLAQAEIEKSPNDPKHYETLILDNQLQVLLISDPEADKASASLNVAVGSSADPRDRAGLAHFLEHMLFLGTEKYPEAGEYQDFISSHGGSHNAYTAQENTNYFFDVSAPYLEPALDRFAQFFIAPRFDEKYVDRERHAVHSEYKAKIKDDYRRGYAATKQAMNPDHSHNTFSVGSLETLADRPGAPVRADLIRFYQRYYSANLMTLVILGRAPLPVLKKMAVEKFSAVPNHQAQSFKESASLFKPDQLPQQVFIEPVKDIRSLTLTFPVPEFRSHWQKKPLLYISSLVGYEGQGSLLSYLKAKGWATSLSASPGHNLETEGSFMVMMQLTESGLEHYLDVTQAVFQYISLIQEEGILESLYNEEKQLSHLAFRFMESMEPIHLTSSLSRQMQYYPAEKVLSADYTFTDFDPDLISTYLRAIRPDNLFLNLTAKGLEYDQTAPNYNTPFAIRSFTAEQLQRLTPQPIADLAIRSENPFIATDLTLLDAPTGSQPELIAQEDGYELWYQFDTEFAVPKANVYFTVQTPVANASAKNTVLNSLFTDMLQEQLNEVLYDAYLAGLETDIYPHRKGFSVRISGYNDKLHLLLQQVLAAIKTPDFNTERFAILKQRKIEGLKNSFNDKPYSQTANRVYELLLAQADKRSQLNAANEVTPAELKQFTHSLMAQPALKVLAHGNLSRSTTHEMASAITRALLPSTSLPVPEVQVKQLPKNEPLKEWVDVDHNDAAITLVLQGEQSSPKVKAEMSVLAELLSAPFYTQLRTEKQLGYIVFSTPMQLNKAPHLAFVIQSPNTPASELETHIEQFLTQWQQQINQLDEQALQRFKSSVISRVTKKDTTLDARSRRYWSEIDRRELNFNSREKLARAVEAVTVIDLKRCLDTLLERRLSVLAYGNRLSRPETTQSHSAAAALEESRSYVPEV